MPQIASFSALYSSITILDWYERLKEVYVKQLVAGRAAKLGVSPLPDRQVRDALWPKAERNRVLVQRFIGAVDNPPVNPVILPYKSYIAPHRLAVIEINLLREYHGISRVKHISNRKCKRVRAFFAEAIIDPPEVSAAYVITQIRPAHMRETDVGLLHYAALHIVIHIRHHCGRIAQAPAIIGREIIPPGPE